jgi:hypothetical protein
VNAAIAEHTTHYQRECYIGDRAKRPVPNKYEKFQMLRRDEFDGDEQHPFSQPNREALANFLVANPIAISVPPKPLGKTDYIPHQCQAKRIKLPLQLTKKKQGQPALIRRGPLLLIHKDNLKEPVINIENRRVRVRQRPHVRLK